MNLMKRISEMQILIANFNKKFGEGRIRAVMADNGRVRLHDGHDSIVLPDRNIIKETRDMLNELLEDV